MQIHLKSIIHDLLKFWFCGYIEMHSNWYTDWVSADVLFITDSKNWLQIPQLFTNKKCSDFEMNDFLDTYKKIGQNNISKRRRLKTKTTISCKNDLGSASSLCTRTLLNMLEHVFCTHIMGYALSHYIQNAFNLVRI